MRAYHSPAAGIAEPSPSPDHLADVVRPYLYSPRPSEFSPADRVLSLANRIIGRRNLAAEDVELLPAGDVVSIYPGTPGQVYSAPRGQLPIVCFDVFGSGKAYAMVYDDEICHPDDYPGDAEDDGTWFRGEE